MDGASLTPEQEKLNALKQVLPEVFAEGKIDWEKLKATLGEDINFSNERYVLNWAGKSEAFKVLQAPTTKTLVPAKDESVNFDETEHIFIEGENLEVLKMLQKSYFGKVKMIYIDPPYNTGKDSFIYPDKFSETKEEYEKRIGDKDEEGFMTKDGMFKKNSKENGQYHSNWLNMMYPRLFLAKNLLRNDGAIFVSIDDHEVDNLKLLMNEVFGEENHVATISIINNMKGRNDKANIATAHEFLLIYGKPNFVSNGLPLTEEKLKEFKHKDDNGELYALRDLRKRGRPDRREDRPNMFFPIFYDKKNRSCHLEKLKDEFIEIIPLRGDKSHGRWRWGKDRVKDNLENLHPKYSKQKDRWDIQHRVYLNLNVDSQSGDEEADDDDQNFDRTSKSKSFWWGGEISTDVANREFKKIFPDINPDYPKSPYLIERIIHMGANDGDIVLDFFSGYGTTGQAVFNCFKEYKKKAKFILVQLPEAIKKDNDAYKAGFKTISEVAIERIKRNCNSYSSIEKSSNYIGFKLFRTNESNFKQWRQITGKDKQALEEQMKLFVDPVAKNATTENMVYELLLKSGKELNSKIEKRDGFYTVNDTELVFLLEEANQTVIDEVLASNPKKVIALDKLFKGNDQLKTNASLQMKDAGIEFKTI
jgi:adenine-specific DNA-methyltransferase